jgi:hypothetical protein
MTRLIRASPVYRPLLNGREEILLTISRNKGVQEFRSHYCSVGAVRWINRCVNSGTALGEHGAGKVRHHAPLCVANTTKITVITPYNPYDRIIRIDYAV